MKRTSIPNTTLRPSVLCLGTDNMGSVIDQETSFALLDTFYEAGGNFFDTANVYANWIAGTRSASEKTLGAWVRSRGLRDLVVIATKGAHPDLSSMHIPRVSPAEITSDLEDSLRNLQVEQIDLYWLHRDDPRRPVIEILETLQSQVAAGKIRYYGCSNWTPARIAEAQAAAQEAGLDGFAADQPMWSLASVDQAALSDPTIVSMDGGLWQWHAKSGMACIPFSAQANGYFHKVERGALDKITPNQQRMYGTPDNAARAARIQALKAVTGLSTTQVILGYLLAQPFPTIPIVGPHHMQHMNDTLTAAGVMLSQEQIAYLEGRTTELPV